MVEHFTHLPNPPADPLVTISAMNALMEGFAYTWLVVNPPDGRTISDEAAIDTLTNLLHHGLAQSSGGGGSSAPSRSSRSAHSSKVSRV
jgi:hypothetical protein